ncbi:MAG: c-type cytochrome [Phycisphaerales bacterium JB040]
MSVMRASAKVSPVARDGRGANPDPNKWLAIGLAAFVVLTLPSILTLLIVLQPDPGMRPGAVNPTEFPVRRWERAAPVSLGASTYASSCMVCHGAGGEGVRGLGKPLRNSAFVQSRSDDELLRLLVEGRPVADPLNTTGALMPARGAQALGDDRLRAVVVHLRMMQDPGAPHVAMDDWELTAGGGASVAAVELTGHPGYELFVSSCSACHGQGGEGIESQGLPLTTSGFVRGKSDSELITFVKTGRPVWDVANSTGIDMPPKGGNPAITDGELQSIVDYLRALQEEAMGS